MPSEQKDKEGERESKQAHKSKSIQEQIKEKFSQAGPSYKWKFTQLKIEMCTRGDVFFFFFPRWDI